jgi:hypothetical protein
MLRLWSFQLGELARMNWTVLADNIYVLTVSKFHL